MHSRILLKFCPLMLQKMKVWFLDINQNLFACFYLPDFKKDWNLTFFSQFLTSNELEWSWHQVFWKADAKSFILRYHLPTLKNIEIWPFFHDFWPWVNSNDLEINFSEKLMLRASFWYIICTVCVNSEIWLKWQFLAFWMAANGQIAKKYCLFFSWILITITFCIFW